MISGFTRIIYKAHHKERAFYPWLQNQFTQVELRSLKSHFMGLRRESGKLIIGDLASKMSRMKVVGENLREEERASFIRDLYSNTKGGRF
ncbi:hypothetical protein K1719_018574 [Acacia pycnantha]|nr:hypothetical protein K1719_018574 [Acacia pycnantha]